MDPSSESTAERVRLRASDQREGEPRIQPCRDRKPTLGPELRMVGTGDGIEGIPLLRQERGVIPPMPKEAAVS
jgi:hypothetical protein